MKLVESRRTGTVGTTLAGTDEFGEETSAPDVCEV
jgi:hypothetical protein